MRIDSSELYLPTNPLDSRAEILIARKPVRTSDLKDGFVRDAANNCVAQLGFEALRNAVLGGDAFEVMQRPARRLYRGATS